MRILSVFSSLILFSSATLAAGLELTSTAFKNNQAIPILYSCHGEDISPALSWRNAPAGTQSFALVFSSPDWSAGLVYFWVLYNIPNNITTLSEGASQDLPGGISVGNNYYNEQDYHGPCPPDNNLHHYIFTLYALDAKLDIPSGEEIDDVLPKIKRHTITQTELVGIYKNTN